MRILSDEQIKRKLARLAVEILATHVEHSRLYLLGINNNGYTTARELQRLIEAEQTPLEVELLHLRLSPADPLNSGTELDGNLAELQGAHVLIVDDVANTGRTALYAMKPLLDILPASVEVAVLVDRKHKRFPIASDYVGLTLSTTLQEEIRVHYEREGHWYVEVF